MHTLTIGPSGTGNTGEMTRRAQQDGASFWTHVTANARAAYGVYADATYPSLGEMLSEAQSLVIARENRAVTDWLEDAPVLLLIDDPEPTVYQSPVVIGSLETVVRAGMAQRVELHITASLDRFEAIPGDVRANMERVDLTAPVQEGSRDH